MWTQIKLQTHHFCAQALKKHIFKSGPPVLRNYSLFTNFISIEAIVHKTLILYEIAVESNTFGDDFPSVYFFATFCRVNRHDQITFRLHDDGLLIMTLLILAI